MAARPRPACKHLLVGGRRGSGGRRRQVATVDQNFAAIDARRKAGRDRFRVELAHGTVVELPGAGHFVFLTQPERVEREMRAFLALTP